MKNQIKAITESTFLPISLVIIIGGGIAWVTSLAVDVKYMKEKVSKIDEVLYRVTVIEQQVKDTRNVVLK